MPFAQFTKKDYGTFTRRRFQPLSGLYAHQFDMGVATVYRCFLADFVSFPYSENRYFQLAGRGIFIFNIYFSTFFIGCGADLADLLYSRLFCRLYCREVEFEMQ